MSRLRHLASEKTLFDLTVLIMLLMPASEIVAEILSRYSEVFLPSIFHPFFFRLFGILGTLMVVLHKSFELASPGTRGKWYAADVFYLLMVIFMILSAVFSMNPGLYAGGYLLNSESPADFLGYFFLFYAGTRIRSTEYRKKLLVIFLIVEAAHGVLAFFQTFDIQITYCLLTRHSGAAYGLTPNSNFYGGLSVFMLALVSGLYLFSERFSGKRSIRILTALFAGFVFYTIMGSRARLVWAGFAVMLAFYLVSGLVMFKANIDRSSLKKYFIRFFVLCGIFAAVFAVTLLFTDFVSEEVQRTQMELEGRLDNGLGSDRLVLWSCGLESVPRHWATGIGLDNFRQALIEKYGDVDLYFFRAKAHNEFINTLVTQGVFAFAMYLVLYFRTIVMNVKKIFKGEDDTPRYFTWIFLAMFVTYLAQSFFNTSVISVAPYFWLVAGLLNCCGSSPVTPDEHGKM